MRINHNKALSKWKWIHLTGFSFGTNSNRYAYSSIVLCKFRHIILYFNEKRFAQSIYILPDPNIVTNSWSNIRNK